MTTKGEPEPDTKPAPDDEETKTTPPKVEWPHPYENRTGLFGYVTKEQADEPNAKPKEKFNPICNALDVRGWVKDEREKGWSLLLAFKDRGRKTSEVALSFAEQMADQRSTLRALGEAGLPMINQKTLKEKLFTALSQVKTNKIITVASQPGRYDDAWLTPIGDVVNGDASALRLTTEPEQAVEDRSKRGTLDGWKAQVKEAFDILDFHSPVLVASTFAGPLVMMLGADSAGLLTTGGSGTGKSTSQRLGSAAVGNPESKACCFVTGSMNILGLETHARTVNGACFHMDDPFVNMTDPLMFSNMIFTLQSGVSKTRGTPSGGTQRKRRWRIFWTASAEETFKTVLDRGMKQAHLTGHDVRAVPISLSGVKRHDDPVLQARTKQLDRSIGKHYGHAFPVFLQHATAQGWMKDPEPLHERVQAGADWLLKWGAQDGIRARAAYSLALALVAAELCQEADLFPTEGVGADDGYIRQAFKRAWLASLGNPDEVIGNTPEAGLQRLQQRAVVQWGAHAKDAGDIALPDQPGQSRADTWFVYGASRKLRGHHYVAVSQDAFRALVHPADPAEVLKLMNKRGMLIPRANGKNAWTELGKTAFAHYKVLADHLGPSLDSMDDRDEDAAPVDGMDTVETPRERAERIRGEMLSLQVNAPELPPDGSGDAVWTAYGGMLQAMQVDAEHRLRSACT